MSSLQHIVKNLNAKPATISLNERFAMLNSARPVPRQPMMQQQQRGWTSQPGMLGVPQFSNQRGGSNGAMTFANRMAAARNRNSNGVSQIGVIGGARNNQQGRSPLKMRSPQMTQQQRAAQATMRQASAQNRRLAQQMLNRPAAVRLAEKIKKRSVMQRLGVRGGKSALTGQSIGVVGKAGQRRSLGGLGSPRGRGGRRSFLAGRLGAKKLSLSQRLGPKNGGGSPQKQVQRRNSPKKQMQQQRGNSANRGGNRQGRGSAKKNRGGNNPNLRYFNQQQQQQQQQKFNRQRGGKRGRGGRGRGQNRNQQNRNSVSRETLDADMNSYWTTSN